MIEPLLITSSIFLGKEMFTTTVTNTTKNIYNGIEKIILNDNTHFKKILDNLDINTKLDIVHTFIIDIHNDKKIFNATLTKTFNYLETILKTIETEIENINLELIQHSKKWFHKYRASNCEELLNNLINHVKILDKRFNLLIKLIKI
jgi:hypothetical protein